MNLELDALYTWSKAKRKSYYRSLPIGWLIGWLYAVNIDAKKFYNQIEVKQYS